LIDDRFRLISKVDAPHDYHQICQTVLGLKIL